MCRCGKDRSTQAYLRDQLTDLCNLRSGYPPFQNKGIKRRGVSYRTYTYMVLFILPASRLLAHRVVTHGKHMARGNHLGRKVREGPTTTTGSAYKNHFGRPLPKNRLIHWERNFKHAHDKVVSVGGCRPQEVRWIRLVYIFRVSDFWNEVTYHPIQGARYSPSRERQAPGACTSSYSYSFHSFNIYVMMLFALIFWLVISFTFVYLMNAFFIIYVGLFMFLSILLLLTTTWCSGW